ncbi:MAG: RAMP superfamily CRISPR-associated protein [Candidatus Cloacimonadales bacterium]|jgi:CRISPR-associated protein Csx10|nr:RAMP superfamily CRISPR-associated protein [Candidatus Cloacimonadota bacterium]MDD2650595.1 RAMP superfamily CRISPR-associated protein [Candidatus Cloacimonadota bacterium]MDD3501147.1 RAMP superfamily CRISPR-associated protein [Candidatus Cloacimonadota bacterium]MDX9978336.1 RAMP superfamily CRISPR-associated protein [Candidatus Cloacimonadales bacterium]
MKLKIMITTQSDTQIGSGRGFGSVIDSDIEYDSYGLPYIPAKRIKGLFRDAALELLNFDGLNDLLEYTEKDIDEVFGIIGSTNSSNSLIFDNLSIKDKKHIAPWLDYLFSNYNYQFNSNTMQSYFTSIRNQTAIDGDKGIAKDYSLRTFRVLKKGFTFEGDISINNNDKQDKIVKMLAFISLVIKRIGTQRNRGFGKIEIEIINEKDEQLKVNLKNELKGKLEKELGGNL